MIYKLLFVGAFPKDSKIFGGNVTACNVLMKSDFAKKVDVIKLDTTQSAHPLPNFFIRLSNALKRLNLFYKFLKYEKVDCVLIFAAWGLSIFEKGVMARIAFSFNKPVLFFPRGGHLVENYHRSFFSQLLTKFALRKCTKVLCQGEATKKICSEYLGFKEEECPIVRNWTATEDLLEIGKNKEINKKKSLNFLFVGWLDFEKGIRETLQAFKKLSSLYPISLDLIGDGNSKQYVESFINNHSNNNIFSHGWMESEKVNEFYKKADVLLLPSWLEGFPNVIVESMASKVFVISTKVGNISDAITHEQTGFIIKKRDSMDLFYRMKDSIENFKIRETCTNNAYKFAQDNFSAKIASKTIIKHINQSVENK